jgi:hypothetical protein
VSRPRCSTRRRCSTSCATPSVSVHREGGHPSDTGWTVDRRAAADRPTSSAGPSGCSNALPTRWGCSTGTSPVDGHGRRSPGVGIDEGLRRRLPVGAPDPACPLSHPNDRGDGLNAAVGPGRTWPRDRADRTVHEDG